MADAASLTESVRQDAETVYNYHRMGMSVRPASAIFCLCSLDVRVAARAAQLYLDGVAPLLIFSGGSGVLTAGRFGKPEAEAFADVARAMGVPEGKMIVEPRSTNTGENVRFTHALLEEMGVTVSSLVLVQKPYMERRTYATFAKQWPLASRAGDGTPVETQFSVTSPQLEFGEYPDEANPRDLVINIMVGDLVRIREYLAKGFQIQQEIPDEVWEAGQRLIAAGFNQHLP